MTTNRNLTTAQQSTQSQPPATQTREFSISLAALLSSCERTTDGKRWQIAERRWAAPGSCRHALLARRGELERALIRPMRRVVETMIGQMFLRFPSSANAPDMEARIAAYASDLAEFPAWAVASAIGGSGGSFAPSSADLVERARAAIQPFATELTQINKVLTAETVRETTADERARIAAGFDAAREAARKASNDGFETQREREDRLQAEAVAAVEAMEAGERITLPPMSDRLRAVLGIREITK